MKTEKEEVLTDEMLNKLKGIDLEKELTALCIHIRDTQREAGKSEAIKEVKKIATYLNTKFRKNNTYVRVSADEFNDIWEEELIKEIQKLGELAK